MAKDLTSTAYVKRRIQAITDSTYDTVLGEQITAASEVIESYCRRSFYSRTLDELYDGGGDCLLLREYPVQAILWLRGGAQEVLRIKNTSSSNQRATVEVTSTGLRLVRVDSGTE